MNTPDPCTQLQMAISAGFDGETPAGGGHLSGDPAAHEAACPHCQAFRRSLAALRRPLHENRDAPLPAGLRERLTRLPVEPATVEGPGWAGLLAAPWLRPALGLAVLLLVVTVSLLFLRPGRGSGGTRLAHAKNASLSGNFLTVMEKGEAAFALPQTGTLRVWGGPGTLDLKSVSPEGIVVSLKTGRLCCHWDPRRPIPFRFGLGVASLEIVGTAWRATLDTGGEAVLEVAEGKVKVAAAGTTTEVAGLQKVRISASGAVSPPEAFNPFIDPELGIHPSQIWIGER